MQPLRVRFEQNRGLFMTMDRREPPIRREEVDEVQIAMLRNCEVPGLLPLETEETDGVVSFRYALSGVRMLSEATRTANWTMADLMGALCRLSEVMEDCRHYLLDAERIRLDDEFIFVGADWQDLRFTYVPIEGWRTTGGGDLERLVVRWMMRVSDLDGRAMQQVLRMAASADYKPSALRQYARQYLAGGREAAQSGSPDTPNRHAADAIPRTAFEPPAAPMTSPSSRISQANKPPAFSWKLFQPPSGDISSASEWLGDEANPWNGEREGSDNSGERETAPASPVDQSRWRWKLVCAALVADAIGWRFAYLEAPSRRSMMICLCITLILLACAIYYWNGPPARGESQKKKRSSRGRKPLGEQSFSVNESFGGHGFPLTDISEGDNLGDNEMANRPSGQPRFNIRLAMPEPNESSSNDAQDEGLGHLPAQTTWLASAEDGTALLEHSGKPRSYLIWETKGNGSKVRLPTGPLVIGRSAEAAQHVDDSEGISRAHVELFRRDEQWQAKDLGSRNGSKLNDRPMAPYELYALRPGDRLTLAGSRYRFVEELSE